MVALKQFAPVLFSLPFNCARIAEEKDAPGSDGVGDLEGRCGLGLGTSVGLGAGDSSPTSKGHLQEESLGVSWMQGRLCSMSWAPLHGSSSTGVSPMGLWIVRFHC